MSIGINSWYPWSHRTTFAQKFLWRAWSSYSPKSSASEREDLRRLFDLLKFPEKVVLDNRSTMSGEEGFFERPLSSTTERSILRLKNQWAHGEWCIFGESAYQHHSRTHSYGVDARFNGKMKSVRISIEWNYGTTASLFTFIGMKGKFKVYETAG